MLFNRANCLVVVICCISTSLSAAIGTSPVVLSATQVPVNGGLLHVFGSYFGSEASLIRVKIHSNRGGSGGFECENITVLIPDKLISCYVTHIGTGKGHHIEVEVNGVINTAMNTAFSRHAPKLETLTYYSKHSIVMISGNNFGLDAALVNVSLDGVNVAIISLNNTQIICSAQNITDSTSDRVVFVQVTVDKQTANDNLTLGVDVSSASPLKSTTEIGDRLYADNQTSQPKNNNIFIITYVASTICALMIISLVVALFVMKNRKRQQQPTISSQSDNHLFFLPNENPVAVEATISNQKLRPVPMVRDSSLEEINLNDEELNIDAKFVSQSKDSITNTPRSKLSLSFPGMRRASLVLNGFVDNTTTVISKRRASLAQFDFVSTPPKLIRRASQAFNDLHLKFTPPTSRSFPKVRRNMPPPLSLDGDTNIAPIPRPHSDKIKKCVSQPSFITKTPSSRLVTNRDMIANQHVFDSPDMSSGFLDSPNMGSVFLDSTSK